jgi:hypothetical protein
MPVDAEEIGSHIADYNAVTGNHSTRFVCPITLRECETHELIDGHILNRKLRKASRRTVVQYADVDNFYGTRVEPSLIRYVNSKDKSLLDLLKESKDIRVAFADGTEAPAFLAGSRSSRKAETRFPRVSLMREGTPEIKLYVRTRMDDPRLSGPVDLVRTVGFSPAHWVASMLKAGHLALFEMLGYRVVFDAFGDSIRRSLNQFYQDYAGPTQASKYFQGYRNAVKFVKTGGTAATAVEPLPFDTLADRAFFLHHTPKRTVFAATCIFQINDISVTVTLPQATSNDSTATAVEFYERLMRHDAAVPQTIHLAKIEDGVCKVDPAPFAIGYWTPERSE